MDSVYHHDGLLVVEKSSARAVEKVFNQLKRDSFPIESIIPVNAFGWDDDKSMRANNTSCFNYRSAVGSGRLSEHAYGHAIDINPLINPFFKGGKVYPSNGVYVDTIPGTILAGDPVINTLRRLVGSGVVTGRTLRTISTFQKTADEHHRIVSLDSLNTSHFCRDYGRVNL